ncbi:hypothetical protein D3C86_1550820 [compost metagenome]
MRERRQIARGADRTLGRNHRQHIGVGQLQQGVGNRRVHARVAARQAHGLGGQHQAHHTVRKRRARAGAVRQHEIALQLRQAFARNARVGQLTKAGIDAIDHPIFMDDALHRGLGVLHRGQRLGVQPQPQAAAMQLPQRGEVHRAGAQP